LNPLKAADPHQRKLNPEAWAECYGDLLYRYVVSRLRDRELAEELVQQTFLAALAHREQFTGAGSEKGWLMSILKRKMIDHLRARSRTRTLDNDDGAADALDEFFDRSGRWRQPVRDTLLQPLDSIDREEFWPVFQQCLSGLPEKQAGAFLLREVDDRGADEICKDLDVSTSNLWVLLHRARLRLANCMKKRWLYDNR
jgi:RNA polymerase sigma-70 factor (ECF subfamily)